MGKNQLPEDDQTRDADRGKCCKKLVSLKLDRYVLYDWAIYTQQKLFSEIVRT